MSALTVTGLQVEIGSSTLVEGIDLTVEPGEWVGIIGPNGAGKTTILRSIAGLLASRGSIVIDGVPGRRLSRADRARMVGLVPQRPEIPPGVRVIDYVLLGRAPHLRYLQMHGESDVAAAWLAMTSMQVDALAGRMVATLSGGELQRVVLARALAQSAPLLFLDEPTASLDVGHAQQVLTLVDELRRTQRLTVVSAIHDLTLAAQFCDRLVLVAGGHIVATGSARSVLTESSILAHYGARVRVLADDIGGVVVIPVRDSASRHVSMGANPMKHSDTVVTSP
jgi:iron complex transport system ATP-binding protein